MNLETIPTLFLNFETVLASVWTYLKYFWWGSLFILIIKALMTKSEIDKVKRNMILIKCITGVILSYTGLIILKMVTTTAYAAPYHVFLAVHILCILLMLLNLGILLFYSGTPFIFFNKRVQYSWPFTFLNEKDQVELGQ